MLAILSIHCSFLHYERIDTMGLPYVDIQHYIIPVIADAVPKDFLIAVRSLMDFQYLAQATEISDRICTEIDTALEEFHDHKQAIILARARLGKGQESP